MSAFCRPSAFALLGFKFNGLIPCCKATSHHRRHDCHQVPSKDATRSLWVWTRYDRISTVEDDRDTRETRFFLRKGLATR